MNPDVILCEPSSLVGTGHTSGDDYIAETIAAVRSINPDIVIMEERESGVETMFVA